MKQYICAARRFVKDVLFPQYCIVCKQEGTICCVPCKEKAPHILGCSFISHEYNGHAVARYTDHQLLQQLLQLLKYSYDKDALHLIKDIIKKSDWQERFLQTKKDMLYDVIIPVPLHPKRHAARGFNQAELFAGIFSELLDIPIDTTYLERKKQTKQQASLDKSGRKENMRDAFILSKKSTKTYKRVLLVDDVHTTGETLYAASQPIQESGAAVTWLCLLKKE